MSFRPAIEPAALALLLALALVWPLHSPPVEHHGEAREGLVVQSIVDQGEWILPHRNGELPSKPPLFHWLAATAVLGFGLSDGVLRLPSAVAAWGVACLTFALGRAMGTPTTGWFAVGALFGMVPFLTSAIEARVDMVFTACVTAALTAFFFWYRDRAPRARTLMYVAISAGVLAKGPIGAVLPALVIVIFLLVQRDLRGLRELWSTRLVAFATLVDVVWYALATASGGHEFVALQLLRENWSRLVGSEEFRRTARGHTLRMRGLLATQFLPWTLALAACAVRRARGGRPDASERFLHVWWMVVLTTFTLAAGKRPVYLLPAAPALALLAGRLLAAVPATARFGWRPSLARLILAIVIFDVGALVTLQIVRESTARRRSLDPFVIKVAELMPGRQSLPADSAIRFSDRMVIAYRLRRPIPRQNAASPGLPYLVPSPARLEAWCAGATLLAESGQSANDIALMLAPLPGTARRASGFCRPAGAEGGPLAEVQPEAGSPARLLLPLGDSSPGRTP